MILKLVVCSHWRVLCMCMIGSVIYDMIYWLGTDIFQWHVEFLARWAVYARGSLCLSLREALSKHVPPDFQGL